MRQRGLTAVPSYKDGGIAPVSEEAYSRLERRVLRVGHGRRICMVHLHSQSLTRSRSHTQATRPRRSKPRFGRSTDVTIRATCLRTTYLFAQS